jgi:F1F0 ATPase subunit 2
MTMNETATLVLVWMAGGALGAIFFGGLWWTVSKGVSSPHPALWFLGSILVRMGIVLTGFYYVGHGDLQRLLACLLGFVMARIVVLCLTRTSCRQNIKRREVNHAP